MVKLLSAIILFAGALCGQAAPPSASEPPPSAAARSTETLSVVDLPRLPPGKVSVVGGTVRRIDLVHDQIVVGVFGARDMKISFDTRTALLQENRPVDIKQLRSGMAVSIDTLAVEGGLFAKTIRVPAAVNAREIRGQVVAYDASRGRLIVRDELDPSQMQIAVTAHTTFGKNGQVIQRTSIREGDLVRVTLGDDQRPGEIAERIEILAERGNLLTFGGNVIAIDLRTHTMALTNKHDATVHEVAIDHLDRETLQKLHEGDEVNVEARFDGKRYSAQSVTIASPSQ